MRAKLAVTVAVLLASMSSLAQVMLAAGSGKALPMNWSARAGMDYWSGSGANRRTPGRAAITAGAKIQSHEESKRCRNS